MTRRITNSLKRPPRRFKRKRTTLVLATVLGFSAATSTALTVVVFDPAQYAENLRQVVAVLDQIDRATRQIRNQWQMLQRIPVSVGRSIVVTGERIYRHLTPVLPSAIPELQPLSEITEARFPLDFDGREVAWVDVRQQQWTQDSRTGTAAQRRLQNQVFANFEVSRLRVEQLLEASNAKGLTQENRPGQTAVLQVQNELLATVSHETDSLVALRIARLKAESERQNRLQTEVAYNEAKHDFLVADWPK